MPHPIRLLLVLAAILATPSASAQTQEPAPLVVMNLAAHPDDEDGSTLAYYRWAKNAVAYSVIYTRGEGGQNEAGPDLYERLGAIRTQETEEAARILGTQVYFLNYYDFGFSKHAHEAFAEWSRPRRGFWDTDVPPVGTEAGRDSVTARIVYLIRKLKPDVLFTNHDTTTAWPNAQHGQHQAVGISAYDAFALASDPAYHPEQLTEAGVDLWQPQRLFLRQWQSDGTHDVAVPVSDPCPTGRPLQAHEACTDMAVRAAARHVSQGFDKFAPRFRRDTTYFVLMRSAPDAPPLPAGTNDLAAGLNYGKATPTQLREAPPNVRRLTSPSSLATPGQILELSIAYPRTDYIDCWTGDHPVPVPILFSGIIDETITFHSRLSQECQVIDPLRLSLPEDLLPTLPQYRYQYSRFTNQPLLAYRILQGRPGTTPEYILPLEIAPPVTVDLDPSPIRLVPGENEIRVRVRTYDPAAERVRLALNLVQVGGRAGSVGSDHVDLAPEDTVAVLRLRLVDGTPTGAYEVHVRAEAEPTSARAEPYAVMRPAAVLPDVSVAEGLRVGFVRSYDRVTEDALHAMGADVTVLDSTALAGGNLDRFDTIVLDIRAYLVRADLRAHNDRLLDWVRRGGHLVVGYHKTFEWNPGGSTVIGEAGGVPEAGWAPYPLVLSHDRVTYEDAPVTVLQPDHHLFQSPHAVTEADWGGWVQERGLYFPTDYDDRYTELLSMHDPGEAALTGSLLLADVGDGTYLYTALGWYRQLEALNPGAWRLFANLVSLPLTDGR